MPKIITDKKELVNLILEGISIEELSSGYDYSGITDMRWMFDGCSSLSDFDPSCFSLTDFSDLPPPTKS